MKKLGLGTVFGIIAICTLFLMVILGILTNEVPEIILLIFVFAVFGLAISIVIAMMRYYS